MQAHPLTAQFPVERDRLGRLPVEPSLKIKGLAAEFAAGDAAWFLVDDVHCSVMSCQHGRPMGRFAGHNVVCDLLGQPLLPLRIDWYTTIDDVEIQKTTISLIFKIEEHYARDADAAISECHSKVLRTIRILLDKYPELKLDRYKEIKVTRQHHAMQGDEFALWCKEHSIRLLQRRDKFGKLILQIDYSKDKIPETEFKHSKKSQDHYMLYDEMKKEMKNLPQVIEENRDSFADMIVEYIERESIEFSQDMQKSSKNHHKSK